MRKDEKGQPCPETLGEYRDLVRLIVGNPENPAVKFLDAKIAESKWGRDEVVFAEDSQMRQILFPLMTS